LVVHVLRGKEKWDHETGRTHHFKPFLYISHANIFDSVITCRCLESDVVQLYIFSVILSCFAYNVITSIVADVIAVFNVFA